jgi:hypothetical protein
MLTLSYLKREGKVTTYDMKTGAVLDSADFVDDLETGESS